MEKSTEINKRHLHKNFEDRRKKILSIAMAPIFTVLMIISAKLSIPLPILPISFQVTVAVLAGLMLGAKLGFVSQILYLLLGLIGLPIFSRGGGIEYVMSGSFGYIIGFVFAAIIGGIIADFADKAGKYGAQLYLLLLVASLISLLVCYMTGVLYLYALSNFYTSFSGSKEATIVTVLFGAAPYFLKDVALSALAAELARRLWSIRPARKMS